MDQYIQFVINHWSLWLLFATLVILIIYMETTSHVGGVRLISPQDVVNLINREKALVLDIRELSVFQAGHIIGAKHVPEDEFDKKLTKFQKHKTKPVIISDSTGQKAAKYGAKLKKEGFEKVFGVKGGVGAWQGASLPLVTN